MSKLTPQEIIKAVVAASGRTKLAAERLKLPEAEIIAAITDDQSTLAEQLRTQFILNMYDTLMQVQITLQAQLEHLSPGDVARSYAAMSSAFAALTSRPSEDATEQPVDIATARERLADRLDQYEERRKQRSG